MKNRLLSGVAVLLVASASVFAAETAKVDLEGVKCAVADKDATADKSADYKEGKVFFCCNGCAGKFAKTPEKFATQANRQLVQTHQYEQKGCPISGGKINPETMIKVDGTKVAFCCKNCKAKVEGAEKKEASELVFGEKAFAKGFKKAEKKEG
ncbi:hypothetical protein [Allorhodopirellula heiligendammensis]|uniref:YHS domain protein n=1 Tax=Allorhodopirellula heiligendammensis TaxID=2714739 RepID=A0A5C6C4W2_9BACT|nr:hypothetical protein [Allorhodopirellula heiligendammensis]TWU19037.1 YHS domain protein [Allorhodopirellula heiligendammensis]|tara:strand:- start:1956 stop:2414 length:459 start_codon:yes stop_codon:yes gene_type:complete